MFYSALHAAGTVVAMLSAAIVAPGCEKQSDPGGPSGLAEAGAGGVGCESYYPECCSAPDRMPCRGLAQEDCAAREYCHSVAGTPWSAGDRVPWNMGGAGTVPESQYVGCLSACGATLYPDAYACVVDPTAIDSCYWTTGAVPDGWEYFTDSAEVPAGYCEQ